MAQTIMKTKGGARAGEDARAVIRDLVGDHAIPIIEFLIGKEKTSEFIIAEALSMEINEVRNTLYRLLEHNLVSFLRKKDRIKGWYICYWDYHPHMVPQLKHKILESRLERMTDRLAKEEGAQFYICRSGCQRVTFDEAMEIQFKCGECGSILSEQDNTRTKEFLREQIATLERDVAAAKPIRSVALTAPEPVAPVKAVRKTAPAAAAAPVKKTAPVKTVPKSAPAKKAAPAPARRTPAKKATGMAKVLRKVFAVTKRR